MKYEDLTRAVGSIVVSYAVLRASIAITGKLAGGVRNLMTNSKEYNRIKRRLKEKKEIEIDGRIYRFVDYQGERAWYEVDNDQTTGEG